MSIQVIGRRFNVDFCTSAVDELHFVDDAHLDATVVSDAAYSIGTQNHFGSR
jgi:hypothetical protein